MPLEGLIPSNFNLYEDDVILKVSSIYINDLSCSNKSSLRAELHMWKCQCENYTYKPGTVIDTLPRCKNVLPKYSTAIKIICHIINYFTKPERIFSKLKCFK